jgi:hypothetical protein
MVGSPAAALVLHITVGAAVAVVTVRVARAESELRYLRVARAEEGLETPAL